MSIKTLTQSRRIVLGLGAAAIVGLGSLLWASIPDANGVIHGCYKSANGSLRVIDSSTTSCQPSELAIQWNQVGPEGPPGPPGPPGGFATVLAGGDTLKGVFTAHMFQGTLMGPDYMNATTTINFQVPLASAPVPHYLAPGAASTTECPGTVASPAAAPGHLCVYAFEAVLGNFRFFYDPTTGTFNNAPTNGTNSGVSPYGTTVFFSNPILSNITAAYGSWAVTAGF